MLHSQVLISGYQLAQAAGVRESMSCASRDSGFAELCERFAGSQATEFMKQLGNLGINSNIGLIATSVFWLEQVKKYPAHPGYTEKQVADAFKRTNECAAGVDGLTKKAVEPALPILLTSITVLFSFLRIHGFSLDE